MHVQNVVLGNLLIKRGKKNVRNEQILYRERDRLSDVFHRGSFQRGRSAHGAVLQVRLISCWSCIWKGCFSILPLTNYVLMPGLFVVVAAVIY